MPSYFTDYDKIIEKIREGAIVMDVKPRTWTWTWAWGLPPAPEQVMIDTSIEPEGNNVEVHLT